MVKYIVKKTWILGAMGLMVAMFLLLGGSSKPHGVAASGGGAAGSPGTTVAPLLSCPNVDGSSDNGIRIADILAIVQAFHRDWPNTNYYPLYDLVAPYNSTDGTGGQERINDILAVVARFHETCPAVDTQIAKASIWGIQNVPVMENAAALHAIGYYEASSDVPGQGVHYVNLGNWDGTFDPAAPEGLVYQNGRIAAQLYVVDGSAPAVGWGTYAAGPCSPYPCPGAVHGIDLEGNVNGPQCSPACSWSGSEGWHLHHYLCTMHIGTSSAVAIPGAIVPSVADTQAHCASGSGGEPQCSAPITTTPCYQWGKDIGWMGHLWNWLPNANQIPDGTGMNGRFADCFPDVNDPPGWMGYNAYNCPA